MKKRDILKYSLLMAVCSFLAVEAVAQALMGHGLLRAPQLLKKPPAETVAKDFTCSERPPIDGLDQSSDPHLQKLAQYQTVCNSLPTTHMMIFTDMPKDQAGAQVRAQKMAVTLREFDKYKITPIVIAEPTTDWGDIDFTEFKDGLYDPWITVYFKALRAEQITDQQMGLWVPFPEANLPYWNRNNAKPEDFGTMVNRYLLAARQSFPTLRASVLLNSATYEADDFDWARGEYLSLVPYVKGIQPGLVESFGLQGFPWVPPANRTGAGIFDAAEFLNHKLAQEAADALKVKKIWFNTGTFGAKYVGDPTREATVDPEKRTDVLNGILSQAKLLQTAGYTVSINLFAENKGSAAEGTDWSYFGKENVTTSPASPVFTNFAARTKQSNIELWLFDRQAE